MCSSSGPVMDDWWRSVVSRGTHHPGNLSEETMTAAFIDADRTVVSCLVQHFEEQEIGLAGDGVTTTTRWSTASRSWTPGSSRRQRFRWAGTT